MSLLMALTIGVFFAVLFLQIFVSQLRHNTLPMIILIVLLVFKYWGWM